MHRIRIINGWESIHLALPPALAMAWTEKRHSPDHSVADPTWGQGGLEEEGEERRRKKKGKKEKRKKKGRLSPPFLDLLDPPLAAAAPPAPSCPCLCRRYSWARPGSSPRRTAPASVAATPRGGSAGGPRRPRRTTAAAWGAASRAAAAAARWHCIPSPWRAW